MRRLTVGVAVSAVVAIFAFGLPRVPALVSPLARVSVSGAHDLLNPSAPVPRRVLDVVADGFVDAQYVAELPTANGVSHVDFRFPWALALDRIVVIGWSRGEYGDVQVSSTRRGVRVWQSKRADWTTEPGRPPLATFYPSGAADVYHVTFRSLGPAVVNSIQCYVTAPRWQSWLWFAGLQIIAPWAAGAVWTLALVGWGRLLYRPAGQEAADLFASGRRLVVGLTAMTAFSGLWFVAPREWMVGLAPAAMYLGLVAPGFALLIRKPSARDRRLAIVAALAALLLVTTVAVDSTLVADRRVKPMDHLFGLMTAQHLTAGLQTPPEMTLRTWLVPALAAPPERAFGRFSYWMYLGQMAWINALGVVLLGLCAGAARGRTLHSAAFLAVLPVTILFHFPGQRVLVASLSLWAVVEWTSRCRSHWCFWGAWAAAAAVLAHPGALFVLPPAAIYFLFARSAQGRRVAGLGSVMTAAAAYGCWTAFTTWYAPDVRNNLAYYPIMRTLDDEPPRIGLATILRDLPQKHWRDLAWNRVVQLRHYLWADNPWHGLLAERLYAVSLFSSFGAAFVVALLSRARTLIGMSVTWVAIIGPLAFLHLHVGQSFPQFHILPTPFFALAILGITAMRERPRWLLQVVLLEAILHHLYVPMLKLSGRIDGVALPGWFVGDSGAKALVLLPLIPCLLLARMSMKDEPDS
jgi:hypothetical protein